MNDTVSQDAPQDKPIYIYTLSSPSAPEQIRYVGQTIDPKRRLGDHLNDKRHTRRRSWLTSLRKQSLTPIMTIIEVTTFDKWKDREVFWIAFYKSQGHDLTNGTEGGDGRILSPEVRAKMSAAAKARERRPLSEETRRKISAANEGKKASAEARARLSASHIGKPSPRKGSKHAPESRIKMSLSKRGKPFSPEMKARLLANLFSPEAREKRSIAKKGKSLPKHSPEAVERSAAAKRGKKHTPEARAKMALAKRGHKQSSETIAKRVAANKRIWAMKRNPPNAPTLWD